MTKSTLQNILIIGLGKTGSHLYYALKSSKLKLNITTVKNSKQKLSVKKINDAELIFICTQDDKIGSTVKSLLKTKADLKGKIIAHTSGVHSSDELMPLKKMKAETASFHPVQTFEKKAKGKSNRFKNIYIAIEGTKRSSAVLKKIASAIGSKSFIIDKKFKPLHHICCVISSNFLVTNLSYIEDIYRQKIGFNNLNFFNIYMPLIFQTLSNISHKGTDKALTGPVPRNDIRTVKKHIDELGKINTPEILDYYKFITNKTVKIASRTKVVSKKQFHQLTQTKN
jgi:predicted short-subunit dehydrogenase-like oxidoreductase (DUF2520 family)